jgi:double-strand break repair protein MRE11
MGIAVRPVLHKGKTHLGMHKIGNVKDRFELRSNHVRMYMQKDKDKWFNILLLHQNWYAFFSLVRDILGRSFNSAKRGPQEFVPDGMFDDSVDLVFWGHEHDYRIVPEPVAGNKYYMAQPGSSVATSLVDGEAIEMYVLFRLGLQDSKRRKRHVALLEVQGKEFKMTPISLRTDRPFVSFERGGRRGRLNLNDQTEIAKYLKAKVVAFSVQWKTF